jgi:Tfp pilus assembly protein PilO
VKLNPREAALAWVTGVVAVLGATYLWLRPEWERVLETRKSSAALRMRKQEAELLLSRRGDINERLNAIRSQLPSHPPEKDVTAEFLRTLERLAQQNGLVLLRREAEPERHTGDIHEVSINCNWEGTLDAVVRFLYALQTQGAMLDVRQLTVTPIPGGALRLKGTFTVDFAYTRAAQEANTAPRGSTADHE